VFALGNVRLQPRVYYPININTCLQTCVLCASLESMDKSNHAISVRRSQPARDRILEAARQIFGREGYEHATIRAIAAEAQINPSLVMRYYGNKEALFAAVTDFHRFDPRIYATTPRSQLGEAIIARSIDVWNDPTLGATQRAMVRAAFTVESARAKWLRYGTEYALLFETPMSDPEVAGVLALFGSQIIGLFITRHILKLPQVIDLPNETLTREVGRAIQAYINRARKISTREDTGRSVRKKALRQANSPLNVIKNRKNKLK
jgi:AcrR family transcriptional regulator